jgi:hypothetical protein
MASRQKAQTDQSGYPILQPIEIQNCLGALEIDVALDDILKPSAQTAQMIYGQLVDVLMGAPMNSIENVKSSLLGTLEHKVSYIVIGTCREELELMDRTCMPILYNLRSFTAIGESTPRKGNQEKTDE